MKFGKITTPIHGRARSRLGTLSFVGSVEHSISVSQALSFGMVDGVNSQLLARIDTGSADHKRSTTLIQNGHD